LSQEGIYPNEVIGLQSLLLNFSENGVSEVCQDLIRMKQFDTLVKVQQLVDNILILILSRPLKISEIADMCLNIREGSKNLPYGGSFVPLLIVSTIRKISRGKKRYFYYYGDNPLLSERGRFLYFGIKNGLFSEQDVVNEYSYSITSNNINNCLMLFPYICIFINKHHPALFRKIMTTPFYDKLMKGFINNYDYFEKNNYEKLHEYILYYGEKHSLVSALVIDDIDTFRSISLDPGFDFHRLLESGIFSPSEAYRLDLTCKIIAALSNSIQCYKHIQLNSTIRDSDETNFSLLIGYATAGGSIDILHMIKNEGIPEFGYLEILKKSLLYHHNSIYEWAMSNIETPIEEENVIRMLRDSSRLNNVYGFYSCIELIKEIFPKMTLNNELTNVILGKCFIWDSPDILKFCLDSDLFFVPIEFNDCVNNWRSLYYFIESKMITLKQEEKDLLVMKCAQYDYDDSLRILVSFFRIDPSFAFLHAVENGSVSVVEYIITNFFSSIGSDMDLAIQSASKHSNKYLMNYIKSFNK